MKFKYLKKIIFSILIFVTLPFAPQTFASDRIPYFGQVSYSDVANTYYVSYEGSTVKRFRLTQMDTMLLAKVFNENVYVDDYIYIGSSFEQKLSKPCFEIHVMSGTVIKLYLYGSSFAFTVHNKTYIVKSNFAYFYRYCAKKYTTESFKNANAYTKYEPESYTLKDFLNKFRKYDKYYRILRIKTLFEDEQFYSLWTCMALGITSNEDGFSIYCFKNNLDMEMASLKISEDCQYIGPATVDWAGIPHFYKKGSLIVQYVGENKDLLKAFRELLGIPFADGTPKIINEP